VSRFQRSLILLLLAGCSRGPAPLAVEPEPLPLDEPVETPTIEDLDVRPIPERLDLRPHEGAPPLDHLTLRERIGQLIVPWISGEYWAADQDLMQEALRLAAEERVGGFVVGLGGSAYDLAAKFNALQRAARIPLLIAADLESGPSMRVRGGTPFPGNMAVGATGREADAYAVGRVIALEGRAIGIHIVFAPVVDVNNNPANPIINTRSYGEDPALVGRLGSAFIRGLREHGMLATAKHFPGHGDTGTDSHVALPVIAVGRARLDSIELAPYRPAIAAGVDAVMTAHVAIPVLTGSPAMPATLSAMVLDTVLRGQLGFRGLVVTDALNMGAIVERYGAGNSAVMALQAGADILLMPSDVRAAMDAIEAAVLSGRIGMARLDSSVARVLAAKANAGLFRRRTVELEAINRVVAVRAHTALADSITRRSLVLVRDSQRLVPLRTAGSRTVVITYADEGDTRTGTVFLAQLRSWGVRASAQRLYPASGTASLDSVRSAARGGATVIFVAAPRPAAWRPDAVNIPDSVAQLINGLARGGVPVIAVSFGSPYIMGQMPAVSSFLAAWAANELTERAAADALAGRQAIAGRLPVSLPPLSALGSGLSRSVPAAGSSP
jgi:beta-N-acetylhexosaminidase